jgi:hypothetical protein
MAKKREPGKSVVLRDNESQRILLSFLHQLFMEVFVCFLF